VPLLLGGADPGDGDGVLAAEQERHRPPLVEVGELFAEEGEVVGGVVPGVEVPGVVDGEVGEVRPGPVVVVVVRLREAPDPVGTEPRPGLERRRDVQRRAEHRVVGRRAVGRRPGEPEPVHAYTTFRRFSYSRYSISSSGEGSRPSGMRIVNVS